MCVHVFAVGGAPICWVEVDDEGLSKSEVRLHYVRGEEEQNVSSVCVVVVVVVVCACCLTHVLLSSSNLVLYSPD